MQIALFDSWNGKFSNDIRQHWEELGHKVVVNPRWEDLNQVDINFFYQADNALIKATREVNLPGRIYAQCVDIEVWAGQAAAVDWNKVSGVIFMAEHIKEMVNQQTHVSCPQVVIKPGVNTDKFTLREKPDFSKPIRKIAYVVGDRRIWDVKRLDIVFQLLRDLLDSTNLIWQLHIRGTYSSHEQYNAYCRHLQKDLRLDDFVVWHENRVEDMNIWLEDKDYFILPSTKEAFSYATAETMSKGIKPIIGNWQSAKETWGKFVCETYGQMLAELTKGVYEPEKYRQYVVEHYDQKRYLNDLDNFILKGGELR
jgi:hypothetical protein